MVPNLPQKNWILKYLPVFFWYLSTLWITVLKFKYSELGGIFSKMKILWKLLGKAILTEHQQFPTKEVKITFTQRNHHKGVFLAPVDNRAKKKKELEATVPISVQWSCYNQIYWPIQSIPDFMDKLQQIISNVTLMFSYIRTTWWKLMRLLWRTSPIPHQCTPYKRELW